MTFYRSILLFLLVQCFFSGIGFAQEEAQQLNQRDLMGKAHGLWYIHTQADKGEPAQTLFGHYDHGDKTGVWYVSDATGNISSIENFKFNVRDGEVKYFENGMLTCIGHYRGLNPKVLMDTVYIVDPVTGAESTIVVPTEHSSVRHGNWRFYDALSGRLIREEEYQVDKLIYKKEFVISSADSVHYQRRNRMLPHNENKLPAPSHFRKKESTKSLIGE